LRGLFHYCEKRESESEGGNKISLCAVTIEYLYYPFHCLGMALSPCLSPLSVSIDWGGKASS